MPDDPSAAVSKSSAPVRERGYVNPNADVDRLLSAWGLDNGATEQSEVNPDLRWPLSVKVFDRMRREDFKVKAVMRAVKAPLLSTQWRLDPAAASDEVVQFVSRELGLPILGVEDEKQVVDARRTRGRFSWQEHLRLSLLMLDFGHMAFEQVYRFDEQTGRHHLKKLGPRFPSSIAKWHVARDGGLKGISQHKQGAWISGPIAADKMLGIERLVVYSNEREGAEWWGQSLLRSAYKSWLIKDRLMRVDGLSIERNGMGIPVHTAPEVGDHVQDKIKAAQDQIEAGLRITQDLRSGDNAGASLAYGAKLDLVGVTGQLPNALKSIQYHDDGIGTAVLANFLNLGRQTGSWALGTTYKDFFVSSLNVAGRQVCDVGTQHIVEDLVDLNFGTEEPAPRIVYDDLAGQDQALAYAIKALVDAGVLTQDEALESHLRAQYKLPQHNGKPTTDNEDSE